MDSISGDEKVDGLLHRIAGLAPREMRHFSAPDLSLDVEAQQTQQKSLEHRHVATSDLLRLILVTAGHGVDLGPADKRLWQVRFAYKGQECLIFFGKTGLRLRGIVAENVGTRSGLLVDEIDAMLTKGIASVMEKGVQPLIDLKLQANEAIVLNQHARYLSMFEYFRDLLREMELSELELEDQKPSSMPTDMMMSAFGKLFATRAKEERLSHLTIATIAAYFSMLEHRFVLMAGFRADICNLDFSLTEVLRAGWRRKFQFAFGGLTSEKTVGQLDHLEHLSQTYRNPLLHGGGGGSTDGLVVRWLPNFRSVVSAKGQITDKYMLWSSAISVSEVKDILLRIDSLETWMEDLPGYAWVREGLAVNFEMESLREYAVHLADGTFEQFVDVSSQQFDRALNFE
ncbi:hypothetical protein AB0323_13355 [Arthrobacter sp. NPDC080031]|uniref:hypothetical protein n=1 Tax=Arthrobacter sp. NPDC080031 TaxID=3155918 RepID=UPI00344E42D5